MRISLQSFKQVESNCFTIEQMLSMDELCAEVAELVDLKPVQVMAQVTETRENLYHVKVKQQTEAMLNCSRCLKPFSMPLDSEWEMRFTEQAGIAYEVDGEEIQLLEAEQQLDLTPFIREALLLMIPYAPICKEDCQGLCSICGVDRNQIPCGCADETIDPRWAKLQDLSEGD